MIGKSMLILALSATVHGLTPLVSLNQWPGGFESSFTVQAQQRVSGWKVHLLFDVPVYDVQVWKGSVIQRINNAQEYVIQNNSFDGELSPGEDLIVEIQGYTTASSHFSGNYYIEGYNNTVVQPPVTSAYNGSTTNYDYKEALRLSILFYDAQRSGRLPANNPIPWRSNSHVNDSDNGHDLSGGWYIGGEHIKYSLPMAESVTLLEWSFLTFKDGYKSAGLQDMMCDMIKWPLEYFLKTWIPNEHTLYVQVGDSRLENFYGKAEYSNTVRPAYKVNQTCPGSDVAANVVSALAAGALLFGTHQPCSNRAFGLQLQTAAKSLYQFAKANRGLYSDCLKSQTKINYRSLDDRDDLSLAASWLYKVTHKSSYLNDALAFHKKGIPWSFGWMDESIASDLLLYEITRNSTYKVRVADFINDWMPGGQVTQTACGLAYKSEWGTLRYTANTALLALLAARDGLYSTVYKKWAMSQIDYMLGDNKYNISYEVGFGDNYPLHIQHKGSTCPNHVVSCDRFHGGVNYNLLKGTLVGGPDINDTYADNREDYNGNQVGLDYNAGFHGALAGLVYHSYKGSLPAPIPRKC